jgi:hypothetical protein
MYGRGWLCRLRGGCTPLARSPRWSFRATRWGIDARNVQRIGHHLPQGRHRGGGGGRHDAIYRVCKVRVKAGSQLGIRGGGGALGLGTGRGRAPRGRGWYNKVVEQ